MAFLRKAKAFCSRLDAKLEKDIIPAVVMGAELAYETVYIFAAFCMSFLTCQCVQFLEDPLNFPSDYYD